MIANVYTTLGRPEVTLYAAVGTAMVSVWFLKFGPVGALRRATGRRAPESRLWYSANTLYRYLKAVEEETENIEGRRMYRRQLGWDVVFALVYGPGLMLVLAGTYGRLIDQASAWRLLIWVPLLATLFDMSENLALSLVVGRAPEGSTRLARSRLTPLAATLTAVKTGLAWSSLLLAAGSMSWIACTGYRT